MIDYLGHAFQPRSLEIAAHTADAIQRLNQPRNITKLRPFLGLCNVFRRFVPKFALTALPLNLELQ